MSLRPKIWLYVRMMTGSKYHNLLSQYYTYIIRPRDPTPPPELSYEGDNIQLTEDKGYYMRMGDDECEEEVAVDEEETEEWLANQPNQYETEEQFRAGFGFESSSEDESSASNSSAEDESSDDCVEDGGDILVGIGSGEEELDGSDELE